jgi:hypothetical protein
VGVTGALIVLVFVIIFLAKGPGTSFDAVARSGTPARGILLEVSSQVVGTVRSGIRRFVRRTVTIDVEVPGQTPYVTTTNVLVPSNLDRDVLPGATVELRVTKTSIVVVGPGAGFAVARLGTTQADQGAA